MGKRKNNFNSGQNKQKYQP